MSGFIPWDDREHWGQPGTNVHVASSGNYGSDPGHDDETSDQ